MGTECVRAQPADMKKAKLRECQEKQNTVIRDANGLNSSHHSELSERSGEDGENWVNFKIK